MDQVKETEKKPRKNNLPGAGPGRPKGSVNKVGKAAKDAIAEAAERLGGADRLVTWAQSDPANERAFWSTIYPKLLPLEVRGAGPNGEHMINGITVTFRKPDAD